MINKKTNKKAQEEIVGFALIIVVVAVILLVFLSYSLKKSPDENVNDYEVNSFLQATLQYTTSCQDYTSNLSVQNLIFQTIQNKECLNKEEPKKVLEETLNGILEEAWKAGQEFPVKYYKLEILESGQEVLSLTKGTPAPNCRTAYQEFSKSTLQYLIRISFTACY